VLVVARSKFGVDHWDAVASLAEPTYDRAVRANAMAAMSWIAHDELKRRMAMLLDEDDPLIQWTALNGLARLGSPAVPVLQTYQPDDLVLEKRRQKILAAGRPATPPPRPPRSESAIPLILDCDADFDDSIAIALAGLHPDCSLEAVSIVGGGGAPVADGVATASAMLELCERDDVPVLGGIGRGAEASAGQRARVFDRLADIILRSEGRAVVVATGPLTNVAVLLRAFPQLVNSIKEIVFLGCAFGTTGNVGPIQEANVCADPEAAGAVFRSGARIRIVPLDLSQQLTIDATDGERLALPSAPLLQQQLAVMLAPLLSYYRIVFARNTCPVHDPLAVALALRPDLFRLRRQAVSVELTGELTRGVTIRDERPEAEGDNLESPIEVADWADLGAVRELLDCVLGAVAPASAG
jgi:inosine-uridine nucleoside N-ribohydrolase